MDGFGYDTAHVVAGRWNGPTSVSTLFLDGTSVGTDSTSIVAAPAAGAGVPAWVGRPNGSATGRSPDGFVYAVAVFDVAHSDADIADISAVLATAPTPGRTVTWADNARTVTWS